MLPIAALILAAALLAPLPAAARADSETVRDWTAACDAEGCVAATEVGSTDGFAAGYILRIARRDGADARWTIAVSTIATLADRDRPIEIRVDDRAPLTLRPTTGYAPFGAINDFFVTDPPALKTLFAQMIAGDTARFTFLDVTAAPHDVDFSLSGLSAVLLWIDDRQGRLGSPRRAAAPRHLDPAPEIDRTTAVARLGVPPRLLHLHRMASRCEDPDSGHMRRFRPLIRPLSRTATLYGVPCTAGADNTAYRLYIVESGEIGGIEPLYFATYSDSHGWAGTDMLFNISFDAAKNRLSSLYKGRGVGDCGTAGRWVWKKFAFAMESFRSWSRCDGSRSPAEWPVVFPARP